MQIQKYSNKTIKSSLDIAWSFLVKLLANNRCAYCNREQDLHAHHIHTRKRISTRWDTDNGICLCADHHVHNTYFSAHQTPYKFLKWMDNYMGIEFMEALQVKSNQTLKLMNFEKQELLEGLKNQINELK